MPPTSTEATTPDYYYDDNGCVVFTRDFLLRRGTCCNNGCRHCPYREGEGEAAPAEDAAAGSPRQPPLR